MKKLKKLENNLFEEVYLKRVWECYFGLGDEEIETEETGKEDRGRGKKEKEGKKGKRGELI